MTPLKMNKRVKLQTPAESRDVTGAQMQTWANFITTGDGMVWAGIADMTGRQYVASRATQNAVVTKIQIRYRDGVVPSMRVLQGSDIYDIEAVLRPDPRWLDLMCVKGASHG